MTVPMTALVRSVLGYALQTRFSLAPALALIGALVGTAAAFGVSAESAPNSARLYNVGVDVASRSLADRRDGAAKGLEVMLTRLSGLTSLPESQALAAARRQPERYYAQYRYYGTSRYDELGQKLTELNLQFSPRALRALMLDAQLPLWTLNRPRVAVWLAERSGAGTDLIDDPEHPLLAAVLGRADYRGLPSVVPGSAGLSTNDVWNRDAGALRVMADSAGAELMLVGRAEQLGPDEWQVRWSGWTGETSGSNTKNLSLSGSLESVSAPAVDMLVSALVNQFTVAGGEAGTLELIVENISAVPDYAELLKYLSSLSYIESVSVGGLRGDELSLLITTTGSPEKLMQLLAIDSRLVQSTRPRRIEATSFMRDTAPPFRENALSPEYRDQPDSEFGFEAESGPGAESFPEYGSRSAITVTNVADAQLRVAWQG